MAEPDPAQGKPTKRSDPATFERYGLAGGSKDRRYERDDLLDVLRENIGVDAHRAGRTADSDRQRTKASCFTPAEHTALRQEHDGGPLPGARALTMTDPRVPVRERAEHNALSPHPAQPAG